MGQLLWASYPTANFSAGLQALPSTTTGTYNTAVRFGSLQANTTGSNNTAYGLEALFSNNTGSNNTAIGYQAFSSAEGNSSGNTAIGSAALLPDPPYPFNGMSNTAIGYATFVNFVSGNNNVAIGSGAGAWLNTGDSNVYVSASAPCSVGCYPPFYTSESGVIRIGTVGTQTSAFIAGIQGVNVGSGVQVLVNSSGQLGTISSSRRYKEDIQDMGDATDGLMRLRP